MRHTNRLPARESNPVRRLEPRPRPVAAPEGVEAAVRPPHSRVNKVFSIHLAVISDISESGGRSSCWAAIGLWLSRSFALPKSIS